MSRLIDADALKELLYYDKATCAVIDEVPTIDPVKHGKWIDKAVSIKGVPTEACSECGEWSYGDEMPFCPNCGASMDMDGGEDDGPV